MNHCLKAIPSLYSISNDHAPQTQQSKGRGLFCAHATGSQARMREAQQEEMRHCSRWSLKWAGGRCLVLSEGWSCSSQNAPARSHLQSPESWAQSPWQTLYSTWRILKLGCCRLFLLVYPNSWCLQPFSLFKRHDLGETVYTGCLRIDDWPSITDCFWEHPCI